MLGSLIANVAVQTRGHLDVRVAVHRFNRQALPQQVRIRQAGEAFEANANRAAAFGLEEYFSTKRRCIQMQRPATTEHGAARGIERPASASVHAEGCAVNGDAEWQPVGRIDQLWHSAARGLIEDAVDERGWRRACIRLVERRPAR